jgi:anti-sigma factor RsiW
MNCEQIQDLLPLYVGSDLEESRARLVTAHVQTCEGCADAAREYRETRQLLQKSVPPAFTESFYAEMRQSVWQNLEKKSTGRAFSGSIADLFRPRLAWAVATAVLIAVAVVGIYVMSRRSEAPQPFASHQPPASTTPNEQPHTSAPHDKSSASLLASSGSNSPRPGIPSTQPRQRRKTISDRVNVATVPAVAAVSTATISAPEVGDSSAHNRGVSDDSRVPLRVEIQTKNPNIRIIWFAPGDTKQLSPNSKGT